MGFEKIKVGDTVYSVGNKLDGGSRVIEIEHSAGITAYHVVPTWYSGDEEWRYRHVVHSAFCTKEKP